MWHNVVWIGGFGLVAAVAAWLLCHLSGYSVAAWVAPLAIGMFCLGLYVGIKNTVNGRFRVPLLGHHILGPHLAHRSVFAELHGVLERVKGVLSIRALGRDCMNMPAVIAAIAYPLVLAVAVYERLPISDWLTAYLPL